MVRVCKVCGTRIKVNPRSRLCQDCAYAKVLESITQMRKKEGPIYDKWRESIRANL